MSKHNYTQYSKKNENYVAPAIEEEVKAVDTVVEPVVETEPEIVETKPETVTVTGTVVNCAKLNVRAEANATADVVCVLDAASEIEINVNKSTAEWFSVCSATGIEGFCMRKFIQADL